MTHAPGPWTPHENEVRTANSNQRMALMAMNHEMKANARLIASAPDLLRILEDMTTDWRYGLSGDGIFTAHIQEARAAIAKAKGE
jgi:hypothetical protein